MPIGYMGVAVNDGDASVYVHYDATKPYPWPLINDAATGFCLVVRNTSGGPAYATIFDSSGALLFEDVPINQGDPVTTGSARCRTVTQMRSAGYSTVANLGSIELRA
jgi:hypothetical protein